VTLRRSTSLRSRSAPKARKPVRRVNRQRKARNFDRAYGGAKRRAWLVSHPCIIGGNRRLGCRGVIVPAHTKGGGMGHKGDAKYNVPMCDGHHQESHRGVQTFAAKYGVNLSAIAASFDAAWLAHIAAGGAA